MAFRWLLRSQIDVTMHSINRVLLRSWNFAFYKQDAPQELDLAVNLQLQLPQHMNGVTSP